MTGLSSRLLFAPFALAAALVAGAPAAFAQTPAPARQPTFTKDVAPILQRSCQNCHRPGSIAPMSLLTYAEARQWARAIKLMVAAREGRTIPEGWALDREGRPTTDPKAGLEGSMLPMGGAKGAMLALVVELLVTSLTGAAIGFEATSFFVDEGNRPRLGQAFLVVDPGALAGGDTYFARVEALIAEILRDDGVRLPGARRDALAAKAARDGIEVPQAVADTLAT